MKLNNKESNKQSNIITDDDIIISDKGNTLSEILQEQQDNIDSLKSNVKWLYKYGGTGSGKGGGGESTAEWGIYATLGKDSSGIGNTQLSGQVLTLDGEGQYYLYVKINKPAGATFSMSYSYEYMGATGIITDQKKTNIELSAKNTWTYKELITLNTNSKLVITVYNSTDDSTNSVYVDYITSPYKFIPQLLKKDGTTHETNEVYVTNAVADGITLALNYNVAIDASELSCDITFQNQTTHYDITDRQGIIKQEVPSSLFKNENAGLYNAEIKMTLHPQNGDAIEKNYTITFYLIPETLYIVLNCLTGTIYPIASGTGGTPPAYNPDDTKYPAQYSEIYPGSVSFDFRVYQGSDADSIISVSTVVKDKSNTGGHTGDNNGNGLNNYQVKLRDQKSFRINATQSGWNTMTIQAGNYWATYCFYIKEVDSSLDWYDKDVNWQRHYYNSQEGITPEFSNFKGASYIETGKLRSQVEISNIELPSISGNVSYNTMVSFGVQLNAINNDPVTLLTLSNEKSAVVFTLTSTSFRTSDSTDRNIRIQRQSNFDKGDLSKYHLIQIYSQFVKRDGNDNYYKTSVYIDGVLEGSTEGLTMQWMKVSSIKLEQISASYNLIEVAYRQGTQTKEGITSIANCDYEVYKYYLKYKDYILHDTSAETAAQLLSNLALFNVDDTTGRVTTTADAISNIASNQSVPVMMMTYDMTSQIDSDSDIMDVLELNYDEDGSSADYDASWQVSLSYSPGNTSITPVTIPGEMTGGLFKIRMQGSSTKSYRVKNFTLSLVNAEDEPVEDYLFSPNFNPSDTETFLPEQEFTLKADVVDSSHSNNTSCGRFVNTVCKKFITSNTDTGYDGYIKNCLEGYPFLLFLQVIRKDGENKVPTYYFLGVYNFNLGRQSYFNLGYKDLNLLKGLTKGSASNGGFAFHKISSSMNTMKTGLGVGEIQGNDAFFDFSQFSDTILFQQDSRDNLYMFGDLVYEGTEDQFKQDLRGFVKNVANAGGYIFGEYCLKKNFANTVNGRKEGYRKETSYGSKLSINQVPGFTTQFKKSLDGTNYIYTEDPDLSAQTSNNKDNLKALIIADRDQNIPAILDYDSVSEYYTICMALGLVDSVQKNLNIKTWDRKTWFVAFYDMDTCLGISNSGDEVSSFAFSDYWYAKSSTDNDIDYPKGITVFKDFAPASDSDSTFDVPSNYLFAVAKYAKLFTADPDGTLVNYPQELYARWRAASYVENDTTGNHYGVLSNADTFMEHFFKNALGSVIPALISYNYRSKYFKLQDTTWQTLEFQKFNGTRINQTREWLESRLHLLDMYFGLNTNVPNYLQYYRDGIWQNFEPQLSDPAPSGVTAEKYKSNDDVIILKDIFGSNQSGIQLTTNANILVTCPKNSPLQIVFPNSNLNYIIGGDRPQSISFSTDGNQKIMLGGSSAWQTLSTINWINYTGTAPVLAIKSDKLSNLTGSTGNIGGFDLTMPNLSRIDLTSSSYTGNIEIDSTKNGKDFSNLETINISGSKLNLTADMLPVKEINLNNVSASSVHILNCTSLRTLSYSNLHLSEKLELGVSDTLIAARNGTMTFDNLNIFSYSITCTRTSANNKIVISNDSTVRNIQITGFNDIEIHDCKNLESVVITPKDGVTINSVSIYKCTSNKFKAGTSNLQEGVVDFSDISIGQVYFHMIVGAQHYKLRGTTLNTNCFHSNYNMKTLTSSDGKNFIIKGSGTFYACPNYTMKQENGTYTPLQVAAGTTSLQQMFDCTDAFKGVLTLEDVQHFFDYAVPDNNNIQNVALMFYSNPNIVYNATDLKNDIVNEGKASDYKPKYLRLNKLSKVTNMDRFLLNTGVTAWHKNSFKGVASQSNSFYSSTIWSHHATIPIDVYTYVYNKANVIGGGKRYDGDEVGYDVFNHLTTIVDAETGEALSTVNFYDFLHPGGNAMTAANQLLSINSQGQKFNFHNDELDCSAFQGLTNLNTVYCLMYGNIVTVKINGKDTQVDLRPQYTGIDGLFASETGVPLANIYSCFSRASNTDIDRIDLFQFMDWRNFTKKGGVFCSIDNDRYWYKQFQFDKYIGKDDYISLCNYFLEGNLSYANFLFCNCNITGWDSNTFEFGDIEGNVNTTIKELVETYANCKLTKGENDAVQSKDIGLNQDFFKRLYGVTKFVYTFASCHFSNPIYYNFFNRRTESLDSTGKYYYKSGNSGTDADYVKIKSIYTYSYENNIVNGINRSNGILSYAGMFYDCIFATYKNCFDPTDTIQKSRIKRNRIVLEDNHNTEIYEGAYYTKTQQTDKDGKVTVIWNKAGTLKPNPEMLDLYNIPESYFIASPGQGWSNNHTSNSSDKLCIPPDFFSATSTYAIIAKSTPGKFAAYANVFAESQISGILPANVFSTNRDCLATSAFRNCYIVPQLIGTHTDETGKFVTKLYSHFPANYLNVSNLDYAFDCHVMVPVDAEDNSTGETIKTYNYVVSILENTVSAGSVTSMQSAFNDTCPSLWNNPSSAEGIKHKYNFIGTMDDSGAVTLGFNMDKFKQLKVDNLFNTCGLWYAQGQLFNMNRSINTLNRTNINVNVFYAYNGGYPMFSQSLILPECTQTMTNLAAGTLWISKDNISVNKDTSYEYYLNSGFKPW